MNGLQYVVEIGEHDVKTCFALKHIASSLPEIGKFMRNTDGNIGHGKK